MFEELVYDSYVRENLAPGSKVLQVKAVDHDKAQSDSTVDYMITRGTGLGRFTIDKYGIILHLRRHKPVDYTHFIVYVTSCVGWIRTAAMLDRETMPFYWLTVYAHDQGSVPLSSSVEVYIEVGDVNDNAPEPDRPVYQANIMENSPAGVEVIAISVSSPPSVSLCE